MQAKAGSSAAKGAKQATGSSVNRGWMPSSYYSSSTFTSHNPFVSHGTRAKAFALPSQMQFHDALFYDATDSVADALEQDDLPFIETTPRTRVAAIGARSALICVAILTATLYYVAFLLGRQHVPVLLVLSLAIATVATGLLALSCTGILGIQRLAALGATPHAQHRFRAPSPAVPPAVGAPARVVPTSASASASAAAATTSVGSAAHRSVPSMPAYFDAAALGIMTSDDDSPALHTFHALGGADDAPKHSTGAQSGEGGSDSETFHLSLAPTDPDSLDAPAALSAAAPGSAATVTAVPTPLAATPPPASDATAEAGEYSGALAAFFDGGGATDDDALLAALSPAPVNVHVHPRSSAASASLSASAAAPADGVAGVGAGAAAAAGGDVMSATEDSDAGLTRVRARSRSCSSGRHGLLLSSVNAQTPAKGRRSGRNATARPGAGGGHSAAATALSLITAFLTYATPVAIVLLTVSGLLAAFPAHASAYVHVRWHEALTQSSAVTPIAYTPSVAAAAWSAPNAAGVASNGTSLAPLPSRNRMGVAPSLRRSHRLVSLALRVVATVTLLSGLLVAAAAGLVYAWLLPVALPPVPIFASATPVAGVTAAVLISAGAVMDISAGDCAHTTAVAAALARSAAATASSASAAASSAAASLLELTSSAAVNAVVSVNSGAHTSSAVSAATAAAAAASTHASVARAHAHAALSFFWGSSERVCAHSRAPVFMSALLLLTGVSLLALVMLNIFTLKKVFHPSRPSPVAAAAAATTAPAGSSAGTVTAPAPAPAHEAAGGTFRLKARTQLSWDMVSAQTRRVLAAIVLLAFPVMIVSLLRSEVGLHQHLLSSPAVAHDISVKVMGAHLLQTAATGSQPPAIAAGQNRAKAGKSSAAATAAVATMGPFESIAEAREDWFEHVAAVRTAHSASSTAQGSAKASTDVGGVTGMVDALGMTSGVDTGAEEDASSAAAATAAATLASEDPVRIDLARKVSHEFDKISLVAYVHVTALSVLVILSFVIVFSYIGLGVKAERLVSVSTGEYSVR